MDELLKILTEEGLMAWMTFLFALVATGQSPLNHELLKQANDAAVDEKIAARLEEEDAARVEEEQIGRRHIPR